MANGKHYRIRGRVGCRTNIARKGKDRPPVVNRTVLSILCVSESALADEGCSDYRVLASCIRQPTSL